MPGLEMKYFVLNPQSKTVDDPYARASRIAMEAYAKEIRDINPELSFALSDWINRELFKESELAINEKYGA